MSVHDEGDRHVPGFKPVIGICPKSFGAHQWRYGSEGSASNTRKCKLCGKTQRRVMTWVDDE